MIMPFNLEGISILPRIGRVPLSAERRYVGSLYGTVVIGIFNLSANCFDIYDIAASVSIKAMTGRPFIVILILLQFTNTIVFTLLRL